MVVVVCLLIRADSCWPDSIELVVMVGIVQTVVVVVLGCGWYVRFVMIAHGSLVVAMKTLVVHFPSSV